LADSIQVHRGSVTAEVAASVAVAASGMLALRRQPSRSLVSVAYKMGRLPINSTVGQNLEAKRRNGECIAVVGAGSGQ
jgi:hypothetical protein